MAMFQNPSDMVEEDAADLQFPKDEEDILELVPNEATETRIQYYNSNHLYFNNIDSGFNLNCDNKFKCTFCKQYIAEPYIKCAECPGSVVLLCLHCFCCGSENSVHKSTHAYKVFRDDNIQVFPSDISNKKCVWLANEEKRLLDLLYLHGYGNWEAIGKEMNTKTAEQCREHYLNHYFGDIFEKTIGLTDSPYVREVVPLLFNMSSIDPPRFDIGNANFKRMAGYRSARSDFDTPYDPSAESIVSNLNLMDNIDDEVDPRYDEVFDELNCALFKAYNHRLKERKRRYDIIREHGLLMASRTLSWISKHAEALESAENEGKCTGRFVVFMQLMPAITFDALVEALQYATDLKKYIYRLYDLRKNGVKSFFGGQIYHKLKIKRLSKIRDKKAIQYESLTDWRNLIANGVQLDSNNQCISTNIFSSMPRRKAAPLEILGLPGYDKINDDERSLCSTVRLSPLAYLEYKNILITENSKNGFLRLAEARRLIKIDVNKTRQMYDFLLKFGFINKPFN